MGTPSPRKPIIFVILTKKNREIMKNSRVYPYPELLATKTQRKWVNLCKNRTIDQGEGV